LLPALQSARRAARTAVGVSNLRQMGIAMTVYSSDYRGYLPIGFSYNYGSTGQAIDWSILINAYMPGGTNGYEANNAGENISPIFTDPNAHSGGKLHYSGHPVLLPTSTSDPVPTNNYSVFRAKRAAEVILVMDGGQDPYGKIAWNAYANAYSLSGGGPAGQAYSQTATDNNDPMPASYYGSNLDDGSARGYIRWRQRNNNAANFLFVDGHVTTLEMGQVLNKNLRYDP